MPERFAPRFVNPVKEKLATGGLALGMAVRALRAPDVARIARASGHDFLFIDVQHSVFNLETIAAVAHTALGIGIAPLVRVRGIGDPDVPALLDSGVTGIVYPDIDNAGEARRAVETCRFPPLGERSVAGGYPMFDYAPVPVAEAVPALDAATLIVCMIETLEGLENVEEIAAVEGVDVLHMGTNDLLANMGKAGRFDDPEILAAQERVNAACARHGKIAGCGGNRDIARQAEAIRKGVRFLTTQTDIGFLSSAAAQWTRDLHAAIEA